MTRGMKSKKYRRLVRKEFRHYLKYAHRLKLKDRLWLAWQIIRKPVR